MRDESASQSAPDVSPAAFQAALCALGEPTTVVLYHGQPAVVRGGRAEVGVSPGDTGLPLLAYVPPLRPGDLGDPSFRSEYGVAAAYVAGEMANGIASEALVVAVARAGFLGVFGAAGLTVEAVEQAIGRLQAALPDTPWGVNLIHSPDDPRLEAQLVDLFLANHIRLVSASAYLDLTLPVVKYRVSGIHRDPSGKVVVPNRLMAKVSRVEVASRFLRPPPSPFLDELVAAGTITPEQAELARTIPMADDLTAEADSGGHTDNRPLVLLLPALSSLRDAVSKELDYDRRVRVGAAGGIATPASVASAFAMGAAYVVTGSINQATVEAGTSDAVRELLAKASPTDVAMAPAADMFELGVKVQVLSRGTLFAVRATRLYELYRVYGEGGVPALPLAIREDLEKKFFRASLDEAWAGCQAYFKGTDPAQIERAEHEPRHKLALLFRSYLGQASKWANAGTPDRALDYQIWCGPSMGAFNDWARGSFLEAWENRGAVVLAQNLLVGAAVLTRAAALRTQVGSLPPGADQFPPRTLAALATLVREPRPVPVRAPERDARHATRVRETRPDEPIAIVGLGAMFPEAANLEAFWRLVRTGRDAVADIPASHWSVADYYDADPHAPDKTYATRGAFLAPHAFDPTEFGIPPSVLEATDTAQLLGLVVARMALEDAGYGDARAWDKSRASVVLGVTGTTELVVSLGARLGHPKWRRALLEAGVDPATAADVVERIGKSYVSWQENSFPGLLGNVVAGRIANRLDLGGTNCVLDAACASSLAAVHLAVLELRARTSDLVLTGGVDCMNDIFMHMCFSKTPALSASGDVRPFSDRADGTVLGEGLGMVVLKRLSDAERDGDRIYAQILGIGSSSDGRGKSVYAPLPEGQARALRAAYSLSGIRPSDVTLLEAHGTGTKAGDLAEFEALRAVYREDSDAPAWCTLGTVKSQLGHTKAAAGSAGMIKAALALHHKVLPPTLKVDRPHPSMNLADSPFAIGAVAQPWLSRAEGPRRAGVSSFGFGGSNFHLVLEERGRVRTDVAWDGSVEILALSAADAGSMAASAEAFIRSATRGSEAARSTLRRSRETFDVTQGYRLVAVLPHDADVEVALRPALARIASSPDAPFKLEADARTTVNGAVRASIHYGVGPASGSIAFVFPGQGAQHVGMLRELAAVFPELLSALESAPDVARAIYPLATFDAGEAARRDANLTRTDVAQPALGLVSLGLVGVLERFGVRPTLVAGHSYGELVALYAAGVFEAEGLMAASRARGALMAGDGGDRGTMLAVLASRREIEAVLSEAKLDLVLANRNGPRQGVLSGARDEIERAARACHDRGLRTLPLPVGAAFHGPLVAEAASAFRAALEGIPWRLATVPVIADSTGEPYPVGESLGRDLLARQLASPVLFDDVVERLYALGARTFVEVGPKAALTGMVRAILDERPFLALAVDPGGPNGALFDLAQVLAGLAAGGHVTSLAAWEQGVATAVVARTPKMSVPLTGANYRSPEPAAVPRAVPDVGPRATPVATSVPQRLPAARPTVPASTAFQTFTELTAAEPPVQNGRRDDFVRSPDNAPAHPQPRVPHGAQEEGIRALAAMQEQTARVHQLFLEGQLAAHQSLQALLGSPSAWAPSASPPVASASSAAREPLEAPAPAPEPTRERFLSPIAPIASIAPTRAVSATVDVVPLLLAVVAEATGYPEETLSLEMGMEADLGIDSIKRVEILSMLSKRVPGAPSVNPEKLSALRTLQDVADFIAKARGNGSRASVPSAPATARAASTRDEGSRDRVNGTTNGHAGPAVSRVEPSPEGEGPLDARAILLDVVAQLTGYPIETLSLEMDLEADLGIDSIKRVEILSMLTKRIPGAPSVDPERLSKLRTLEQVLAFASQGRKASSTPVSPLPEVASVVRDPARPSPRSVGQDSTRATVPASLHRRAVVAVSDPLPPRTSPGFPLPVGPVFITADAGGFSEALAECFRANGRTVRILRGAEDAVGPVSTLILLAPDEESWTAQSEAQLTAALGFARTLGSRLREAGAVTPAGGALLVTVSRRDGAFGHGTRSPRSNPLDGGLAGLAKTAAHEWPEVRCRAVDLASAWPVDEAASALVRELSNFGPREVGLSPAGRMTLALRPDAALPLANRIDRGGVVVVTGGARGVTAECARRLALRTGARLLLLGRSPAPAEEPAFLRDARTEAEIKRACLDHARGETPPTPRALGDACQAILAAREVKKNLEACAAAGVTALYREADVRDAAAVAEVLREARGSLGPIQGVVHGAGVVKDKRIEDKRDPDFEQVLGPKLTGLRALLDATKDDDLRFLVLFASATGRFGRRGQADYAVANQALVSVAQREGARRPGCRVVALDWGPWEGGMVTAALQKEFEREGVPLISLAAGADAMGDEALSAPGGPAEVVLGAGFGSEDAAEWSLAAAWRLDAATFPILRDHGLAGKSVLPLALTLEWFAAAATSVSGRPLLSLDDVRVFRGVTVGTLPVDVSVWVGRDHANDEEARGENAEDEARRARVTVELRGSGGDVHVRATATVGLPSAAPVAGVVPEGLRPFRTPMDRVYQEQLFHGPSLEAIASVDAIGEAGMLVRLFAHPLSERLLPGPTVQWAVDPLVLDGIFQALIVWCRAHVGAPALPSRVESLKVFGPIVGDTVRGVVTIRSVEGSSVTSDVELVNETGLVVLRLEGFVCTASQSLQRAFSVEPGQEGPGNAYVSNVAAPSTA